jgi:undecaprenyl-diphosphatase
MDYQLLKTIQEQRIDSLDWLLKLITEESTSITIGVISAIIFLGIMRKKKSEWMIGLKILATFLINASVVITLKLIINRPRPFISHEDILKLCSGGSPSMPSGHSSEVFALAFSMLFILKNKTVFYIFFTWAIIIGYTRIALGVHYPSDVLVGAIIGALIAYGCSVFFDSLEKPSKKSLS